MSEVEKQESQKTVVAFITGLLIGGLLVWVFSSTPEEKKQPVEEKATTEEAKNTESEKKEGTDSIKKEDTKEVISAVGDGSLTVSDQKAGKVVTLGAVKTPAKNGWIVVRDFMDGVPGNILGAARFSEEEGLMPTSVELIRQTNAGSSYQVSFFTNEGDAGFKIGEDTQIEGGATTFKAN